MAVSPLNNPVTNIPTSGPLLDVEVKKSLRDTAKRYAIPENFKSVMSVLTSLPPALAGIALMYWLEGKGVNYLWILALSLITGGFAVRTFIIFHDAGHGSLFKSKTANKWVGRVAGLMIYQSFGSWSHRHAVHHATAGDLDRRGEGDFPTATVNEYYYEVPAKNRIGYRIFRNEFVLLALVPFYGLLIEPRLVYKRDRARIKNSAILNNIVLAILMALQIKFFGLDSYLKVMLPIMILASTTGAWLFFVQHQFEDAYWERHEEWDFTDAAMKGSSFLKLPKIFQFFTGNIGFHHVHHLSSKIPNYKLEAAHSQNDVFHAAPTLTFREATKLTRLALWDEESGKLVSFRKAKQLVQERERQGHIPEGAKAFFT